MGSGCVLTGCCLLNAGCFPAGSAAGHPDFSGGTQSLPGAGGHGTGSPGSLSCQRRCRAAMGASIFPAVADGDLVSPGTEPASAQGSPAVWGPPWAGGQFAALPTPVAARSR